jgi:nicotinate-nucleotide pyrophosphorylase (carboxylating)
VGLALAEDLGPGDVTSALVIPESLEGEAVIEARAPLVACGLFVAAAVFEALRAGLEVEPLRAEGEHAAAGEPLVRVRGRVRAILAGERTALNFVGRLCGIATFTRRCVEAAAGSGALLLDTRKTLPGWRSLDKYATAFGGARNHRSGLYDGILIKDNHLAAAGGVALAVKAARAGAPPHLKIEVEVESLADALAAVEAGADALLLDNRSPAELRAIAERLRSRVWLEASGGVTLASLREVAQSGVHAVSLGALTHSAPAADVALELTPGGVGR